MNIKYQFLTGETVEINVPDHIGEVCIEIDRDTQNSNRRETRRHNSISCMEDAGQSFSLRMKESAWPICFWQTKPIAIYLQLQSLLPQQQELIRQVF